MAASAPLGTSSAPTEAASAGGTRASDTITLVTSDGVPFAVDSTVARECELLRAVLGDEAEAEAAAAATTGATTESIPLALVTAPTLARVLEYYYGTAEEQHAGLVDRWTTEELCQVMLAADYLGADKLLTRICERFEDAILTCISVDAIRVRFGIASDLATPVPTALAALIKGGPMLLWRQQNVDHGPILDSGTSTMDVVAVPAAAGAEEDATARLRLRSLFADAVFCLARNQYVVPAARCVYICSNTLYHDALCHAVSTVRMGFEQRTYLMAVCKAGDLKAAEWWLQHGADIHAQDMFGYTALHLASDGEHLALVARLMELGADINAKIYYGRTALQEACQDGRAELALQLLDLGADVKVEDQRRTTPLHVACRMGLEAVVLRLLDLGADINAINHYGRTPLREACREAQFREGLQQTALRLLERGAQAPAQNPDGSTLLNEACRSGLQAVVARLVDMGADVNAPDKDGQTPLLAAASHSPNSVFAQLLELGADVNAKDSNGETALLQVCCRFDVSGALLLLERGADVNSRGADGATPLIRACSTDNKSVILRLLELGAAVNATDNRGNTPLHAACRSAQESTALALLQHGADVNATDERGRTALQLACMQCMASARYRMVKLGAVALAADAASAEGVFCARCKYLFPST